MPRGDYDYSGRGGYSPVYAPTIPNPAFNINPAPQGGQGAFGKVPGPIGLPPVLQNLASVYPNLSGTTAQTSQNILGQLRGELSPETIANIEDEAARFGVHSGMPGSGLAFNRLAKNIGLSSQGLQQQGIQNFLGALPTVSKTMTVSPELQSEIAARNALFGSAPDPSQAAAELQRRFQLGLGFGAGGGGAYRSGTPNLGGGGVPQVQSPFDPFGNIGSVSVFGGGAGGGGAPMAPMDFGLDGQDNIDWNFFNDPNVWGNAGDTNYVDTQSAYDPNWDLGDFGLGDIGDIGLGDEFGG